MKPYVIIALNFELDKLAEQVVEYAKDDQLMYFIERCCDYRNRADFIDELILKLDARLDEISAKQAEKCKAKPRKRVLAPRNEDVKKFKLE
jgi:hypothetical protein